MIRGLSGQQLEEANLEAEGYDSGTLSRAMEVLEDLYRRGKIDYSLLEAGLVACGMGRLAAEERSDWVRGMGPKYRVTPGVHQTEDAL